MIYHLHIMYFLTVFVVYFYLLLRLFLVLFFFFFFSSRRRHTRFDCDWSSDVCSSDLETRAIFFRRVPRWSTAGHRSLRSRRKKMARVSWAILFDRSGDHTADNLDRKSVV